MMANRKTVYDLIAENDNFSILLKILDSAEIAAELRNEHRLFTFFAPTDGAFFKTFQTNSLHQESDSKIIANSILGRHLVPNSHLFSDDLRQRSSVVTLDETRLEIREQGHSLFLDGAQILTAGLPAANGVVFAVDKVLLDLEHKAAFF